MRTVDLPLDRCRECPLFDPGRPEKAFHVYEIPEAAEVLIIGEAPGEHEAATGRPFVGRAGKRLREEVEAARFKAGAVAYANVLLCRPPGNRDPRKEEVAACWANLDAIYAAVRPKIVVPLGNPAMRRILRTSGVMKKAGELFEDTPYGTVVPSVHPSYVIRGSNPRAAEILRRDLCYVRSLLEGGVQSALREFHLLRTADQVHWVLEEVTKAQRVAFDLETRSLEPGSPILGVGFCWKERVAAYLPLVYDPDMSEAWEVGGWEACEEVKKSRVKAAIGGGKMTLTKLKPWWQKGQEPLTWVRQILAAARLRVAWNAKFDLKHLKAAGVECDVTDDAMLAHYLIDENRSHSLDEVAKGHGERGYFRSVRALAKIPKRLASDDRTYDYGLVPVEALGRYCAIDTAVTFAEARKLFPILRKDYKLHALYRTLYLLMTEIYRDLELEGVRLDRDRMSALKQELETRVQDHLSRVRELAGNPDFNPDSPKQLQHLLYEEYRFPVLKRTNPSATFPEGQPSTDWEVLNRLAARKDLKERPAQLLTEVIRYRTVRKTLSEAVLPWVGKDRVYFDYLLHGTRTGRLSSTPNIQNRPKRSEFGPALRRCFLPDEGHLWLSVDAKQIELRLLAWYSQDPVMLREFLEGMDLHADTARRVYGKAYDEAPPEQQKKLRDRGKTANFSCVPMDVEALTSEGWKTYDQLRVGDQVLGYEDGRLVWVPVLEKMFYPDAPLMELSTSNFSVRTTPNHRWLARRRRDGGRRGRYHEMVFTTTEAFAKEESLSLSAPLDAVDRSGLTVWEAALLGWLVTDGTMEVAPLTGRTSQAGGRKRQVRMSVFQSLRANPEFVEKIDRLMRYFPHRRCVRPSGIVCWTLRPWASRYLFGKFRFDRVPLERLILAMGPEQRKAFIDSVYMAEGTKGSPEVAQNGGDVLEALKLALFLEGYFVSQSSNGVYKGRENFFLRARIPRLTGQRVRKRPLHGRYPVWCIRTRCGTWVMRQSGSVMLTGNSWYGGGPSALAVAMNKNMPVEDWVTEEMAEKFQKAVFGKYQILASYMGKVHRHLLREGKLRTVTGRVVRTPQVFSDDAQIREAALRQGFDALFQGTASDLIQYAAIAVAQGLKAVRWGRLLFTVQDSLEMSVREDKVHTAAAFACEAIRETGRQFGVGFLEAEAAAGPNWGDLEEIELE